MPTIDEKRAEDILLGAIKVEHIIRLTLREVPMTQEKSNRLSLCLRYLDAIQHLCLRKEYTSMGSTNG